MCYGKTSAPVFGERTWRSSGAWMARTGCDFAASISVCDTAPNRRRAQSIQTPKEGFSQSPMADISIWQKTGHFYFALTGTYGRIDCESNECYSQPKFRQRFRVEFRRVQYRGDAKPNGCRFRASRAIPIAAAREFYWGALA